MEIPQSFPAALIPQLFAYRDNIIKGLRQIRLLIEAYLPNHFLCNKIYA